MASLSLYFPACFFCRLVSACLKYFLFASCFISIHICGQVLVFVFVVAATGRPGLHLGTAQSRRCGNGVKLLACKLSSCRSVLVALAQLAIADNNSSMHTESMTRSSDHLLLLWSLWPNVERSDRSRKLRDQQLMCWLIYSCFGDLGPTWKEATEAAIAEDCYFIVSRVRFVVPSDGVFTRRHTAECAFCIVFYSVFCFSTMLPWGGEGRGPGTTVSSNDAFCLCPFALVFTVFFALSHSCFFAPSAFSLGFSPNSLL